jgi:hypothetical protein
MTVPASKNLSYKSDTLSVAFTPKEYAWGVKITNNQKDDISIIWDKSSFILNGASSKVIFDNTLKLNIENSIPDQELPAGSFVEKRIFPAGSFSERWPSKTIDKKEVRKLLKESGKPEIVKIILAIRIRGMIKKYDFNFEIAPN